MNSRSKRQTYESIYDYPLYYDILFGWNRSKEAAFYETAFQYYGIPGGSRLLEIGCGTGQIAIRLAKQGWLVTGLDIEQKMLDFVEKAAGEAGIRVETIHGDMTCFSCEQTFDAAYCPLSTLGYLVEDNLVISHLRSMGDNIRPDGVYIIDQGFTVEDARCFDFSEEWTCLRGGIEVSLVKGGDIIVDDKPLGKKLRLKWEKELCHYNCFQFAEIVAESEVFSIEAWYPEAGRSPDGISIFDIRNQSELPVSGRAMVVLKRRSD